MICYAMCGSFCTFAEAISQIEVLINEGADELVTKCNHFADG